MIRNVVEYLIESVKKYPDKTALVDEHRKITFSELDQAARKVAYAIVNQCGNRTNRPIAVYMEKSVECIIAFLGIVYSGNYYSPLNFQMPVYRIKRVVDTLEPIAIIYNSKMPEIEGENSISFKDAMLLDGTKENAAGFHKVIDSDPVYVLFTSGSTGEPKGVVISHRGVIDYTEWLHDKFHFDEKTVFGNQAPFYFDNSILDIYSTLKNGATMNIIPERLFSFSSSLLEYINENKINTLFWVPSALISVANSGVLSKVPLNYLERVLFCGEVMPNKQLNMWRSIYPDLLYANLYGPTEITDVCTYYIVDRDFEDDESLPIGKECENTGILILNSEDQQAEIGETGELCVRGTCLSMGYYGNDTKTNEAFVQNPLNHKYRDIIYRTGDLVQYNEQGEIIFIGRKDYQIKHQGHRIELGEIETISSSMEEIERSCAVYDDEKKKIILFCSLRMDNTHISEKEIYRWLKYRLPSYMLPAKICLLNDFPMNANGKIDRVKLKEDL